jgi:hypothetical protein
MMTIIDSKETNKRTEHKRLTDDDLTSAIKHLQKVIRKGAVSNEYMHTGRVHSDDEVSEKSTKQSNKDVNPD